MNAGTLEIQLAADVARLRTDMGNALGIVQRTARGFDDAAAQMRNALGGIGGGLSAAAFGTWIKSAIDFQDQLNDLNKTTDIAVSKLAGISLMSKQTGSDLTGMAQAMNKLTLEMGKAPEKFAKIGITAKDPLEAFKQLSEIFRSIEDPQLRAAVAAEALGKGWASAAPALSEGSKAIGDMVTRGEELAGITALDAQMADAFNDSMSELQLALMGTASNLAGDMLPLLTELVKSLTDVTASANNTETPFNILTETLRALIVIGGNVAFVIHGTAVEIGGMAAQAAAFVTGKFSQAAQIGRDMTADAEKRRAAFDGWEQRIMSAGKTARAEAEETKRSAQTLSDAVLKSFVDSGAGAKAANKELEEQARLLAELAGLSGSFAADWARLNSVYAKGVITLEQLTAAQASLLAQQPAMKKQATEQEAAEKAALAIAQARQKARQEESDGIAQFQQQQAANIKSAEEMVKQAQFELSIMGLSNVEREKAIALRELEATGIDKATLKYAELAEAMTRITAERSAAEANKQAAEDAAREWQRASDQIGQSLTDALMSGGKSGADYIRDLFRTMVLRPLLSPVGSAMAGVIGQLPGAGGGSGLLGQVGQMAGLANFGGMSLANSAGSMFANATGGGLDALLATNGAFGTAAGGGGIMGTLSAALPWVGGALAIASMLESPRGGPKTIGGEANAATIQAAVAATLTTFGVSASNFRVGGFSASDPAGDSLTQVQAALFMGDRALYSRQDRVGNYEDVGRSAEAEAAAWAEEQSRIMLAALQATLEPKYQQYINDVSADASGLDAINAALARLNAARTLEEQLLTLSSTDAENMARARQRELDAMDAAIRPLMERVYAMQDEAKALEDQARITGKITSVMGDYLSDTELRAARIWQIHQQLAKAGLEISLERIASATRNDLRALYEEMVRVGDMGAAEALLDVASAFAQITEPANQAATAIEDMAQRLQDAGRGVWDYVRTLTATRAGTASPMDLLTNTRSNYLQDLALSRAGDLDAYGRINSSAQAYIDAQKGYTASGGDTQAVISQIISELNSLPAVQSYEQQNLALLGQIAQATGSTSTSTGGNKTTSDQILARLMEDSFLSYSRAEVASVYNAIANNTNTSASYLSNIAYHSQLMANQLMNGVTSVRSEFRGGGLATFEAGGFHSGGLRLVGERGPELEVTGPSRIFNAQQTRSMLSGSGGASSEEIRGLREDVRRLTAVVASGMEQSIATQRTIAGNTKVSADESLLKKARA